MLSTLTWCQYIMTQWKEKVQCIVTLPSCPSDVFSSPLHRSEDHVETKKFVFKTSFLQFFSSYLHLHHDLLPQPLLLLLLLLPVMTGKVYSPSHSKQLKAFRIFFSAQVLHQELILFSRIIQDTSFFFQLVQLNRGRK